MVDRRIDRVERPRDEGIYPSRIEKDKSEKQKYSELPEEQGKTVLLATFLSYLKKMLKVLSPPKKIAGKVVDIQSIIEHLEAFKHTLEKLGQQELSSSSEYATTLSNQWRLLFDDFDTIEIMQRKEAEKTTLFREMMDAIKNYPPDSEHRLGYYLLQQAGKDWLPFPFIEILENLQNEHLDDPKVSTLTSWDSLINQVIENLKQRIPFNP